MMKMILGRWHIHFLLLIAVRTSAFAPQQRNPLKWSSLQRPLCLQKNHQTLSQKPSKSTPRRQWGLLAATSSPPSQYRLTAALAAMTGAADVIFIRKLQTFSTMMTGNSMWLALAATEGYWGGVTYYTSVILSYMLGLAVFRRAAGRRLSLTRLAPLVGGIFIGSDTWCLHHPSIRWPSANALAMAFGIINSVGTEMAGTLAFVVTGHLTKLTHSVYDYVFRQEPLNRHTLIQSNLVFFGFGLGALLAWKTLQTFPDLIFRHGALTIMGVLYMAIFLWQDRSALMDWWRKSDRYCEVDKYDANCE